MKTQVAHKHTKASLYNNAGSTVQWKSLADVWNFVKIANNVDAPGLPSLA